MNFRLFLSESSLLDSLKNLYNADQSERNEYKNYLSRFPDWQQAANAWVKDKKLSPDDIFNDKQRLMQAKKLIQNHILEIENNKDAMDMAWLLVQHMDHDLSFQQWFLKHVPIGTINHQYLTDRLLVNQGKPQKYGTQNNPYGKS